MTSTAKNSTKNSLNSPNPALANSLEKPYFLGVDVGGTNIKLGLLDNLGKTLAFESIDTPGDGGAAGAIKRAASTSHRLAQQAGVAWSDVVGAGVGTPGPMSLDEGKLLNPSNLPGWHNFYVVKELSTALEKPVSYINDANAAALGEAWIGAGVGQRGLAFFTLGTGVGGGLISDGYLINGVNSFGSEMGHVVVDSRPDARLCVWGGGRGHLEAYASASAVAAQAMLGVRAGVKTTLSEKTKVADPATAGPSTVNDGASQSRELTALDVYHAAVAGDAFALKLIDEAAFYLGIGVTNAVHMIDPGLVLLGGAMNFGGRKCPIGRRFLQGVIDEFQQRTFENVFVGTRIDFATLGGDAGYIGAAAIARQQYYQPDA